MERATLDEVTPPPGYPPQPIHHQLRHRAFLRLTMEWRRDICGKVRTNQVRKIVVYNHGRRSRGDEGDMSPPIIGQGNNIQVVPQ